MELALELGRLLLGAAFAAGGAWVGVNVRLRVLERRVDRLERGLDRAHERIDNVLEGL